jgi:hypothetical protein
MQALLIPPSTYYGVPGAAEEELGGDDYLDYGVYWDQTTAGDPSPAEIWGLDPEPQSCGTFYPNRTEGGAEARASRPLGDIGLVYREDQAVWDHPNGTGAGFCNHAAPDHPGIVRAVAWEEYYPRFIVETRRGTGRSHGFPGLPGLPVDAYLCEYEGSDSGEGPPCEFVGDSPDPYCRILPAKAVFYVTAQLFISLVGDQLVADLGGGRSCSAPVATLKQIFVRGGAEDDVVDMDWAALSKVKWGFNLGGGINRLTVHGSAETDWFGLHGFPEFQDYPAGLAFDIDRDDVPDAVAAGVTYLDVNLGAGNDTASVFPTGLYSMFGNYAWNLDGGAGRDKSVMSPSAAGHYNLGTDATSKDTVALVNLDSDQGDGVDLSAVNVERWTVKGTPAADVFTGAGGAGTGGRFLFPLDMSGAGGNDKLTGGDKGDVLNGGPGNNDVCKGGKGNDEAKGCEKKSGIPRAPKLLF